MKRYWLIVDSNIDYYLQVSKVVNKSWVSLRRSIYGQWNQECRGELACRIDDTGDEVMVRLPGRKALWLNYMEAEELTLTLIAHGEGNRHKKRRIK